MLRYSSSILLLSLFFTACKKDIAYNNVGTSIESISYDSILVAPSPWANPIAGGVLQILDGSGNELWARSTTGAPFNFRKWYINGKVRYSYVEYDPTVYNMNGVNTYHGHAVILDENMNELKKIYLLPYNGRSIEDANGLDVHDFVLLDDDHYISIAYFETTVNNIPASLSPAAGIRVAAAIIQEVQSDAVIWEWNSADHSELYATSVEGNQFGDAGTTRDYVHLNSVFVDPKDENLICSFRNSDQVLKIKRGTGEILWRLGGTTDEFGLTSDQKFLRQHHATLLDDNETLLLLDNGNAGTRSTSRIIEMKLDENSKTVSNYKSITIPNVFVQYMGSVQKIDDSYFVGGGSEPVCLQVSSSGEALFQKTIANPSYRAFIY